MSNDLIYHLKELEKERAKKHKVSRRKEIIKIRVNQRFKKWVKNQ